MRLKAHLIEQKAWSQYLEVGIGPDAEIFTKNRPRWQRSAPAEFEIGIRANSSWNNPEPELVLVVSARGAMMGATLGNDVNLRDFEGRSALLLGKTKDNNASCAIGPFLRLLDATLTLERLRRTTISLRVQGTDGFELTGTSSMAEISRDVEDLVAQTIGPNHQYPDGLLLFCGTMFAPMRIATRRARNTPISSATWSPSRTPAGTLANRIAFCDRIAPWSFGAHALMRNLAARGLL